MDITQFQEKEMVVNFRLNIFQYMESFFDDIDDDDELNKIAKTKILEFLSDVREKFEGIVDEKVFFMDSSVSSDEEDDEVLEKYTSFNLDDINPDYENIMIFTKYNRYIPRDELDKLCLSLLSDYFFGVSARSEEKYDVIISQAYYQGEYDTGYFSQDEDDLYIDDIVWPFVFAEEKLDVE